MSNGIEYPTIEFTNPKLLSALFGPNDQHLKLIEEGLGVVLANRGNTLIIQGSKENADLVKNLLLELEQLLKDGISLSASDVLTAIKMAERGTLDYFVNLYHEEIGRSYDGKTIRAKTFGQHQYVQAMALNDLVFGIGPAGTGKTFLAVVAATSALKKGDVKKIILTRPAVEAGENLGFLPGDLKEKVDPYLRPLYDALYTIYGTEHATRLMDRGVIEIAPLAYMRGRTLNDAFVILDEAQNTTISQMKMFLTRLGFNSKMVVNGDITQIDLPRGSKSGLIDANSKLRDLKRIAFVLFDAHDVVRHPLVADIIEAYGKKEI
ncbi:MAG: PhoH family protein [Bavariicoccus seileri]|uniref:PhoH-like protein n=1 Tax=Bavariicoccus seileri TaxID=549685 RepID=A0A3D4S3T6_9ENTE|nr:PhoH family protein [Bavariicoccus seileri]HCS93296.1 phosphate starvation-inducible protein PhoH [Bavariicoccus seileri]